MIASVTYNTSGSAGPYTITFPFIESTDVEVYLDGVANTAFTIAGTALTLNSAPSAVEIEIRRNTQDELYVDFSAPAPISPEDLDTATQQAIYIAQEAKDSAGVTSDDLTTEIADRIAGDSDLLDIINDIQIDSGNVPTPANPADDNKFLRALSGAFSWVAFTMAMITDATTFGKSILAAATAAAARTLLGSTTVGDAVFIATDAAAARTATGSAKQYTPVTLTPGATVAVDASLGDYFKLTADQNFTLSNPTNPTNGQRILFRILQDGTGSRVMTLDTKYRLGTDITAVVLTTTLNKTDYLGCVYDSTADKWDVVAFVKGY